MNTNHTCDYLDILGLPPPIGDYSDPHRWDKWYKYERAKSKLCCWSGHYEDEHTLRYHTLLWSQVTRQYRYGKRTPKTPVGRYKRSTPTVLGTLPCYWNGDSRVRMVQLSKLHPKYH